MVSNWVAALAAVGGIAVGALVGPHVPGLAADDGARRWITALADRIAIEDMVTRYYGNFGKQDAAEDFGSFYTEDAVFDVNGIVSTGREEIEAFYTDTGDDEDAPAAQGTFHMMISNPVIDVDGDTATATVLLDRRDEHRDRGPPAAVRAGPRVRLAGQAGRRSGGSRSAW